MTTMTRQAAIGLVDELLVFARGRLAKASTPKVAADRDALTAEVLPKFRADLAAYFAGLAERLTGSVRKALPADWGDEAVDWTVEDDELRTVLVRWYTTIGEGAFAAVGEQLGTEIRWDLNSRGVKRILDPVGTRVRGIGEASREALRGKVAEAIDRGYSIEQLLAGVDADGFAGLRDLVTGWGTGSRAETIALTETANAFNEAALAGYAESGLVDSVEVMDGPECGWTEHDDPDLADGSIRTLEEADAYPISHPNCQRAFGPVVVR